MFFRFGKEQFGLHAKCVGTGEEIGLMAFKEEADGFMHIGIGKARAQIIWLQPGQGEEPLGTAILAQHPDKRLDGQRA